ncbi:MAG: hypothetical protein WD690_12165 [Vicinamibacterales bacterium]
MTAAILVMLAMTPASVQPFDVAQGAPSEVQAQAPPPTAAAQAQAKPQTDPAKTIILTGCVVPALDREDSLQLVPAEPDPGRPVGTSGVSPAWTVPSYLLLGGIVKFSEHGNRTVEIRGVLDPIVVAPDPKGDTTMRTGQAAPVVARLQVQSAKVLAETCTPKKADGSRR